MDRGTLEIEAQVTEMSSRAFANVVLGRIQVFSWLETKLCLDSFPVYRSIIFFVISRTLKSL